MTFQEKFFQSLKDWLVRHQVDVVTVLGYDDSVDAYHCETCGGWEDIEVEIKYLDSNGDPRVFTYGGAFSEILKELV